MSTTKTQNYALHCWAPADEFHVSEINENFAALDVALKSEADTAAGKITTLQTELANKTATLTAAVNAKANAADLNTLQTAVSAKAAASDLTALQATVAAKADTAALNAARAEIPHFLTGSYAGTGSAVTVNLGVAPKAVVVSTLYGNWFGTGMYQSYSAMAFPDLPAHNNALTLTANGFVAGSSSNVNLTDQSFTYHYWVWY